MVAGQTARLIVTTAPKAALAYVAVYAGDKSGAAPPFGDGYGGNGKGFADGQGRWSSSWVVRADSPTGPAKVTTVAGWHGVAKQVNAPFTVANPVTGTC